MARLANHTGRLSSQMPPATSIDQLNSGTSYRLMPRGRWVTTVAMMQIVASRTAMVTTAIERIDSSTASGSGPCTLLKLSGSVGRPIPPSTNTVATWMPIPTSHVQKAAAAARGNAMLGAPTCNGTM